jgi:hypothetical protein
MPPVSEKQRRAMWAAVSGRSTLGIPKKVGEEFVGKDASKAEPVERDAFLYLDPDKSPPATFAQCAPCRMFVPQEYMSAKFKNDLCILHGSKVKVGEGYSCGFMCGWPTGKPNPDVMKDHAAELEKDIPGSVTPEESGLVERPVRCENCDYHEAEAGECGLYKMLNEKLPEVFSLEIRVDDHGCCNANTAIPAGGASDSLGVLRTLMRGLGK